MTAQHLQQILKSLGSLQPFPSSASRVLALSGKPGVVPDDLTEIIRSDPGLTAKVLKLCNSAIYGFQRQIASLEEAGNLLGLRTLTGVVMTSATGDWFEQTGGDTHEGPGTWERCLSNAIAAKAIATRAVANGARGIDPETAYVGGLLQDVGALVIERHCAESDELVKMEVAFGQTWLEAERSMLGIHHAEVGARLLTKWGLPEDLVETVRHHHEPSAAGEDHVASATVSCLAEYLTSKRFRTLGFDWPHSPFDPADLGRLKLEEPEVLAALEELDERMRASAASNEAA